MSSNLSPEEYLISKDKKLKKLIQTFGKSDYFNEKKQPFDSLARTIIGQQLSTSAANSISQRIISIHGKRPFKAARFILIDDETLRNCGISKGKIKTIKGIAEAFIRKEISIKYFENLSDIAIKEKLTSYWGIGDWTAEIFMMFCLKRKDTLALGDASLIRAHKILYPNAVSLENTAEKWRPYRAVAAEYLWKFIDYPEHQEYILNKKLK
jgi:DNA-3-methyladenine glycosylase II